MPQRKDERMSFLSGGFSVRCPSCRKTALHTVSFERQKLRHLRCSACKMVNAYVIAEEHDDAGNVRAAGLVLQDHSALMALGSLGRLPRYSSQKAYTDGQYFMHPRFGRGYVLFVLNPPSKMNVIFSDGKRLLACGHGSQGGLRKGRRA